MLIFVAICIAVLIVSLLLLSTFISPKRISLAGGHVLVTGGSSGIGKCLAVEALRQGASVTLLARNQDRLELAKAELQRHIPNDSSQQVLCISLDVANCEFAVLESKLAKAVEQLGSFTALINCAGTSTSGKFVETPIDDFKRLVEVNYLGSVLVTRAVVPFLVRQREGRVLFVSSMAGQLGLFGYTAYSPSKFALRGLAESLQMELQPYNIRVTLAFPPDTDTPGYAEEQKMKPKETLLISESGGLFSPDAVAKSMMNDMLRGRFFSSVGMDGWMLTIITCGFSPVTSLFDAVQQVLLMGPFRVVSLLYLAHFSRIVRKCHHSTEQPPSKKTS